MRRPAKEALTGSTEFLEHLFETQNDYYSVAADDNLNLLDEVCGYVTELTWEHVEIFYLRFGERMSYRKIAARLGYKSPWPVQIRVKQIKNHVKERLDESTKRSP